MAPVEDAPSSLRPAVLEVVRKEPGATAAAVADAMGVAYNTARYHLDRLEGDGDVVRRRFGGRVRFFDAEADLDRRDQRRLAAIRSPTRRRILRLLTVEGAMSVSELSGRVDRAVSTVSGHLRRLRARGLVVREAVGRRVLYRA